MHTPDSADRHCRGGHAPAPAKATADFRDELQLLQVLGERFAVKDRFGLNSKREGLDPTYGSYRQRYRQPVVLAGDSHR